jgi:hypothetical protein
MFRIPRVSISMRELDRLKCIQGLIDKRLKQKAVAERLGLTVRRFGGWLSVTNWRVRGVSSPSQQSSQPPSRSRAYRTCQSLSRL